MLEILLKAILTCIMISEYGLSFGYENKLFESLNPVCQTAGKNCYFIGE